MKSAATYAGDPRHHATDLAELRAENERLAQAAEIVERIMTQHWDMAACPCWVCRAGRDAGLRPRQGYPTFGTDAQPSVRVDASRFRVDL